MNAGVRLWVSLGAIVAVTIVAAHAAHMWWVFAIPLWIFLVLVNLLGRSWGLRSLILYALLAFGVTGLAGPLTNGYDGIVTKVNALWIMWALVGCVAYGFLSALQESETNTTQPAGH